MIFGGLVAGSLVLPSTAVLIDFESINPTQTYANGGTFENGANLNGADFNVDGVLFDNTFTQEPTFSFWSGFSASTTTDTTTAGFGNQYSSFAGSGVGGSSTYLVNFGGGGVAFGDLVTPGNVAIGVTTYTALAIQNRDDAFGPPFGGTSGDEPDLLEVVITGDQAGREVRVVLADYRATDSSGDFINTDWQNIDLSALGDTRNLNFALTSTNALVPSYFALDNLEFAVVPEPSGMVLLGLGGILAGLRRRR